jgi:Transposase zinc-ribbon domain
VATSVPFAPHVHDEAAYALVEGRLWPDGAVCPRCSETARVGRLKGKTTRPGLRKCCACRKSFVKMGTIFESSHVALHLWVQATHLPCASDLSPNPPPVRSGVLGCRHVHGDGVSPFGRVPLPGPGRLPARRRAAWVKAGRRPSPQATRSGLDAGEHGGSLSETGVRPPNAECGLTSS